MIFLLRQLLFYSLISPITIIFAVLGYLFVFFPTSLRYYFLVNWANLFIFLAKNICGVEYRVKGIENIPKEPCVIMCNHQSLWETVFVQTVLPMPQCWVLKKELLKIPFFGWGLRLVKPIAIDRKKNRSLNQVIEQGINRLKEGIWVLIYPEGTRISYKSRKKFGIGGASLAVKSQSPILPVVHNAGKIWPKGLLIKEPGVIDFHICELIEHNGLNEKELTKLAQEKMYEELEKIEDS